MNIGGWKLLSMIFGAISLVLIIFLVVFGFRLVSFNRIKQNEVDSAVKNQAQKLLAGFQEEKETLVATYTAADIFGNFNFKYPKAWSTNISQVQGSDPVFRFLADPELIVIQSGIQYTPVALRVEVNSNGFEQKVKSIESSTNFNNKKIKEEDITVSGTKGKKFTGTFEKVPDKISVVVILPLREKSISIITDDNATYSKHFLDVLDSFKLSK